MSVRQPLSDSKKAWPTTNIDRMIAALGEIRTGKD